MTTHTAPPHPVVRTDVPRRTWSPRAVAGTAGVLYLVIIVCGLFSELLVRGQLVDVTDPSGTAARILDSAGLFRLGFAADLLMVVSDVGLAVLLYVLLRPVSRTLALVAAAFRIVQSAVLGMNLLHHLDAALMLDPVGPAGSLPGSQRDALVAMSMNSHAYGYLIALVFFGIHLAILGYLVVKAPYFPTWLGVLMVVAGAGYLTDSFSFFLVPGYDGTLSPAILAPALVAELATVLWLLVKGVDNRRFPGAQTQPERVAR